MRLNFFCNETAVKLTKFSAAFKIAFTAWHAVKAILKAAENFVNFTAVSLQKKFSRIISFKVAS